MKKVRDLRVGGVKAWLMLEGLVTWIKNPSNIVYEA